MKLNKFLKIESIKKLQKYDLPMSETIFIFNFQKQEKEIDEFLRGRKVVSIRSDKKNKTDFAPVFLSCPKKEAKIKIRGIMKKGYAVILQQYVPIKKDICSGNILILRDSILVELMGEGPLTQLNRYGRVEEHIQLNRHNLKEIKHLGKRLIEKKKLTGILSKIKRVPTFSLLEFTLRPEGLYFWQIKEDKTINSIIS